MFRQFKRGTANRLSDESEPNKLSWTSDDQANVIPGDAEDLEDGELEADAEDADVEELDGDLDPDSPEARKKARERAAALAAELQREAEEYGLTNTDPTHIYGPNGEDVAALIDTLATLDDEDAEAIADAYEAVPDAERKVLKLEMNRLHRGGKYEAELWAAENAVSEWLASQHLDGDDAELYSIVADAATDAVDALVLGDELADVDFNTLYGPWGDVMDVEEEEDGEAEDSAVEQAGASESDAADESDEEIGAFGPNTALVVEYLTRLAALTVEEITLLVGAWREQPKEELRIAHRNLQAIADEDPRWREQLRLAQDEVFAWMSGHDSASVGLIRKPDYTFGGVAMARARETAGPVAADAVAALAMADMLEAEDAQALYAAWADVIGEPELPQYEDDDHGEPEEGDEP
jgi:hypothetical protein